MQKRESIALLDKHLLLIKGQIKISSSRFDEHWKKLDCLRSPLKSFLYQSSNSRSTYKKIRTNFPASITIIVITSSLPLLLYHHNWCIYRQVSPTCRLMSTPYLLQKVVILNPQSLDAIYITKIIVSLNCNRLCHTPTRLKQYFLEQHQYFLVYLSDFDINFAYDDRKGYLSMQPNLWGSRNIYNPKVHLYIYMGCLTPLSFFYSAIKYDRRWNTWGHHRIKWRESK